MTTSNGEAAHHGYAAELVPVEQQGSGWKIFFIVAGSLCGLPAFILSAHVFGSLGFKQAIGAVLLGGVISGLLGACTAYTGSKTRMGLALLSDQTFGPLGARIVKLLVAVSLIGWFGVNIGVLGTTAAHALTQLTGFQIAPLAISLPVCVLIAGITLAGATGLERLGKVLVPAALLVLALSLYLVFDRFGELAAKPGNGALTFGSAVSALIGIYIVGIVIQPDYGRFVRRPRFAALGSGMALGVFYPLIMTVSAISSLATGAPEVVSAMILLGAGIPALCVLLLGAWIDTSACLYSASLSLANQFSRISFMAVVLSITAVGIVLVLVGADTAFIPFLVGLSVTLPPLAAVLVLSAWLSKDGKSKAMAWAAAISWIGGAVVGLCTNYGYFSLTMIPSIDAIGASCVIFLVLRILFRPILTGAGAIQSSQ